MSLPDERFAGFRLTRRLHVGVLAEVWRAEALAGPLSGHALILKRALPTTAEDPALRARFQAEVALARRVAHDDVVRFLDAGVHHALPFLVLEAVRGWDGRALRDQTVAVGRGLAATFVAHVGAALARALTEIHRLGYVHQDVTPANVLIGVDGRVRLADVGAALPADGASALALPYQTAAGYAAPERRAGAPPTERSDLWQLGALLFEIRTGRRANSETLGDAAAGVAAASGRPRGPGALARLLGSLAAARPADRPAAAADIVAALERAAGVPEVARSRFAAWCAANLPEPGE